jgi:hypothetical protein
MLALDYARAATVLSGSRSMFRTWLRSLAFVARHLPSVTGIGVLAALGVAAAAGVTIAYDLAANGRTWLAIVGTIVVHEAMLLGRTAVRVGQVSAQAEYWRGLQPAAVPLPLEPAPTEAEAPAPAEDSPAPTEGQ